MEATGQKCKKMPEFLPIKCPFSAAPSPKAGKNASYLPLSRKLDLGWKDAVLARFLKE
jgi:hypothetical protein